MNTKHTPGPWTVYHQGTDLERPGIESDGLSIVIYGLRDEDSDGVHGRNPDEEMANARLIAAAPELLDALLQCDPGPDYPLEDDMPDGGVFCELAVADMRKIRAAITKATAP